MSKAGPFERLHAAGSPLRRRYHEACRIATPGNQARQAPTLVFGFAPGVRRPTLALAGYEALGPVRHALSQRVVAGVVEVKIVPMPGPSRQRRLQGGEETD